MFSVPFECFCWMYILQVFSKVDGCPMRVLCRWCHKACSFVIGPCSASLCSFSNLIGSFFFNFHPLIWLDYALPTVILKCDWIIHCLYSHALFWLDTLIMLLSLASSWLDIHLLPKSLAPFPSSEPPRFNIIGPFYISEQPSSNVIGPF